MEKIKDTKAFSYSCDEKTHEKLRELAYKNKKSISAIIRDLTWAEDLRTQKIDKQDPRDQKFETTKKIKK
jgi:hypothetical protein